MRRTYTSKEIAVSYDAAICIHAERCVHGAPEVFDPNRRPWIQPGNAAADALAEVVASCPTGALRYERLDGGPPETPSTPAIAFEKDGPIHVRGDIALFDGAGDRFADAGARYALCRCGGSGNKPFCDGTHRTMGFEG